MKKIIFTFIILFALGQNGFGQKVEIPKPKKAISGGVINGKAIYLPKPEYTDEAKDLCAKGKVEVKVLIDKKGNVIEAEAVSGDELLWDSSIKAAKLAKFSPINDFWAKVSGILVYNFPLEKKCSQVERIVNKKATHLPKPIYPKGCRCVGTVKVRIVMDIDGKVMFANAVSGNSLLQKFAVEAALKAKFSPTMIDGPRILIVAYLEYVFDSDGKIKM